MDSPIFKVHIKQYITDKMCMEIRLLKKKLRETVEALRREHIVIYL